MDGSSREGLVGCLAVMLFLVLGYLGSVFNTFFESAHGYVYRPATDELYRIEFTHSPLPLERWRYFVPTFAPRPMEPEFVEYLGIRGELEKEWADQKRLLLEDPDEFFRLQNRELEKIKESLARIPSRTIEERMRDHVSSSADLWWRSDINPRDMLPASWSSLGDFADSSDRLLRAADLIIVKRRYGSSVEVEIAHEVLVVEGNAAQRLAALGPW